MELRQLKYFLAVADQRSFVSAADQLFLSRQAISKSIGQLEAELNVELFMRDSNGAFLTPAGIQFYDRIRSCVMELEQIRADMQSYSAQYHQKARIAFSIGTAALYESQLHTFCKSQESVEIEYGEYPEAQSIRMLLDHRAELAVCNRECHDSLVFSKCIYSSELGVLLSPEHPLAQKGRLTIDELQGLPLACLRETPAEDYVKAHGRTPAYTGYDCMRLYQLALDGACGLLLPKHLHTFAADSLVWLPVSDAEPWKLYLIYPKLLESNVLNRTMLDEVQLNIFAMGPGKEGLAAVSGLRQLSAAVESGRAASACEIMSHLLQRGLAPKMLIERGLMPGLRAVGEHFEKGECFIPEMLVSARAAKMCTELLQRQTGESCYMTKKKVLIGTVKGDLHDIGKNLVGAAIRSVGVEVIDLGVDVAAERFVETVQEDENVRFVAISALLTTTMPAMRQVVAALSRLPERSRFQIMVGGAPVTADYARAIGADVYTDNAFSAAEAVRKTLLAEGELR